MKTTEQWWEEVSTSSEKMVDWLKNQYHGEVTAENRIRNLIYDYKITDSNIKRMINSIAEDEYIHAKWVKVLLESRGIPAEILEKEERYWNKTLPPTKGESFSYMCAVGHLAETMRLERISLLAQDTRFEDISKVFKKILIDEQIHAYTFGLLSTPEDIEKARVYHNEGMNAIGLVC